MVREPHIVERRSLLVRVAGPDTIEQFERAMQSRVADARKLRDVGRDFWAVYTFGYVVEMCLKMAFLRLCGLDEHTDSTAFLKMARPWGRQIGVARRAKNLHDLLFWAELLVFEREFMKIPYTADFSTELSARVQTIAKHWREDLRYRPSVSMSVELDEVSAGVAWIVEHRSLLWR